ncbi:MAG: hypothetical protein JXJ04_13210 [Spirochaetales bacterium]|nr:hypothetical protein [Spirochaetales bacterium]
MEQTLNILNQMVSEGLFSRYTIGGGIAALFYIEPVATFDLDVFVILPEDTGQLITLSPLYEWLKKRGYKAEKEQVVIEGIPVQFIPAYNELITEGVNNALEKTYGKTTTYVLAPEYISAIMIQTSRPKDRERLIMMLEQSDLSREKLDKILNKYSLKKDFDLFLKRYYEK